MSLDSQTGDLRLTGPLSIANISYYHVGISNIVKASQQKWSYYAHNNWGNVNTGYANWSAVVAATTTEYYGVNPTETYNALIGTNKQIFDNSYIAEDALSIKSPSRKIIVTNQWQTTTLKPV